MKNLFFIMTCLFACLFFVAQEISEDMQRALDAFHEHGFLFEGGVLKFEMPQDDDSLQSFLLRTYEKWIQRYEKRQKRLILYVDFLRQELEEKGDLDYTLTYYEASPFGNGIEHTVKISRRNFYMSSLEGIKEYEREIQFLKNEVYRLQQKNVKTKIKVQKKNFKNVLTNNNKKKCTCFFVTWEEPKEVPIIFSASDFRVYSPKKEYEDEYGSIYIALEEDETFVFPTYVKFKDVTYEVINFEYQHFSYGVRQIEISIKPLGETEDK